jgi:glutathione synthase/RimK-type ligase-like ATP-grasp enzyme
MADQPTHVLIVTEPIDPHADAVIRRLNAMDVPVFRLHPEDFPLGDVRISLRPGPDGLVGEVTAGGRTCLTTDIRSAWLRRPKPPWLRGQIPEGSLRYISTQTSATVTALWQAIPEERWVASPNALRRADVKALQLVHAARAGLAIPETLITNHPESARRFRASQRDGLCAVKGLQLEIASDADGYRVPFTAVWADDEAASDASIAISPTIYQQYVEKRVELRCVVMGDEIYCAEMDTQSQVATLHDSRGDPAIATRPHRLPPEVKAAIAQLVASFGIRTASMDLVLEPSGRYVFLELNPSGQWLWIEDQTGLPLTDAMTRLLLQA